MKNLAIRNTNKNIENPIKIYLDRLFRQKSFISFLLLAFLLFTLSGCTKVYENNVEDPENNIISMADFNQCLADNGVVIYGSKFCPACNSLLQNLGGYESAKPVYLECSEPEIDQRCRDEKKTGFVPEIQIHGEVYDGSRSLESLAEVTGCELPQ